MAAEWKGAGICVFVCGVVGGWGVSSAPCSCSPITSCSPWQRGKEFAIWHRPGCTRAMPNPRGLQRDLEHTLAVFVDQAISSRLCAGRGGDFNYARLLRSGGKGVMRSRSDEAWQTSVLTTWRGRSDVEARYADVTATPRLFSMLSPAYYCFSTRWFCQGEIN